MGSSRKEGGVKKLKDSRARDVYPTAWTIIQYTTLCTGPLYTPAQSWSEQERDEGGVQVALREGAGEEAQEVQDGRRAGARGDRDLGAAGKEVAFYLFYLSIYLYISFLSIYLSLFKIFLLLN